MKEKPVLFVKPDDVSRRLCKAFNKLQLDDIAVSKAVNHLRKLYDNVDDKTLFFQHFTYLLKLPLSRGTSKDRMSTFDEKIFEVVCQFATSFLQEEKPENPDESMIELPPFLRDIFDWLLDHHELESSGARLKVCLLVNRLLKLLGEEAEIDDELYQKIYDNMLERLKDKVAEIRAQAVNALQRLQDPRDEQCPIIKAFIFHLGCDPSALVRKAIVRCIGATRLTLPHVIKRTLDIDENVRKSAYKFIAEKVHIRSLTIAKREEIIKRGLTDRNENVRNVVSKDLVPSWLRFCNENIIELLYALDVGNSDGSTATQVLSILFNGVPYEELVKAFQYLDRTTKLIPHDKLSPETATYWRNLATYLHNESEVKGIASATTYFENFMPELTQFCNFVRKHFVENRPDPDGENSDEKEMMWLFNGRQLIEMFSLFDLADVAGRNNLLALVKELLLKKSVPHTFVQPLMKIHRTVQTNAQQRIQDVAEVISELRDPMRVNPLPEDTNEKKPDEEAMVTEEQEEEEKGMSKAEKDKLAENQQRTKVEMAKIKVKLNILKDDLDNAIKNRDFMKAQDLQLEIDEKDEKLQSLNEELALLVVPRSAEKRTATKARVVEKEPELEEEQQPPKPVAEDPDVIHKCLIMLLELLQSPDINSLNATLQTILDEFVKASISSLNMDIKIAALKTLAACSLRSLELAQRHILLFSQIAIVDLMQVRLTALEAIFDLLMWYGVQSFTEQEFENGPEEIMNLSSTLNVSDIEQVGGHPVVAKLSELLDDRDLEIRTKVAEGLCKLLMSKVITSAKLFTRLILMWYNPVTDANGKLRHVLGAFFPLYASLSKENQDSIAEAFMPTLKTLGSAPVTSPLTGVDMEDVGLFLIQLTNRDFLQSKEGSNDLDNCHDGIAYALCNQIIAEPVSFHVKLYTKLIGNLSISFDDVTKLRELKALYNQMSEGVKDKLCLKSLEKFGKKIEAYLEQHPEKDENEEVDNAANEANKEPVEEEEKGNVTELNNTKMIGRKRALFSQTCNTLLEDQDEKEEKTVLKELAEVSDEDDDIFATPKVTKGLPQGQELEITRVEESPLESDTSKDEIVSGNLKARTLNYSDNEESINPTTSTQIEPPSRRTSKRVTRKSSTEATSTESEAEVSQQLSKKRSSKGKAKKTVEPSAKKPLRKSRRLDSSTGTSSDDSSAKVEKKRTRKSK